MLDFSTYLNSYTCEINTQVGALLLQAAKAEQLKVELEGKDMCLIKCGQVYHTKFRVGVKQVCVSTGERECRAAQKVAKVIYAQYFLEPKREQSTDIMKQVSVNAHPVKPKKGVDNRWLVEYLRCRDLPR